MTSLSSGGTVRGYAISCHLPVQGGYGTPLDVDHMNKSSLLEVGSF